LTKLILFDQIIVLFGGVSSSDIISVCVSVFVCVCVCVCEATHLVAGEGLTGVCVAFRLPPVTHTRGAGVLLPLLTVLQRQNTHTLRPSQSHTLTHTHTHTHTHPTWCCFPADRQGLDTH